jgi:WWE domain.
MDLEELYKLGESSCEILICGSLYVIDFTNSQQYRKYDPSKKRRIKRDLTYSENKGIAGLR